MTRLSETLVIQRVGDDLIVVVDDAVGTEITFPLDLVPNVIETLRYLHDPVGYIPPFTE